MNADTAEANLRFLFGWSDAALQADWRSVFEPVPFPGDVDAMTDLAKRYVRMRRKAEGWKPRRYDRSNHRSIAPADLLALIADAQRLDRGERNISSTRKPGRPRKSNGRAAECSQCRGIFTAKRATARFCSDLCRKRAHRAAASAENGTLTTLNTRGVLTSRG